MRTKSPIPDDLNVQHSGCSLTTGFAASSDKWIRLTVTASSNWQLLLDKGIAVSYCLVSRDMGGPVTSRVFEPEELYKTGGTHKELRPDLEAGSILHQSGLHAFIGESEPRRPVEAHEELQSN